MLQTVVAKKVKQLSIVTRGQHVATDTKRKHTPRLLSSFFSSSSLSIARHPSRKRDLPERTRIFFVFLRGTKTEFQVRIFFFCLAHFRFLMGLREAFMKESTKCLAKESVQLLESWQSALKKRIFAGRCELP